MNGSRIAGRVSLLFLVLLAFAAAVSAAPTRLSTVTITPGSVTGGTAATGTATLNQAAGNGGATVTLSSSNGAVASVQSSITIPKGSISGTFPVNTSPVASATSVTITGNLGVTATASFTVQPPAVNGIGISPNDVVAVWGTAQGVVSLNGNAAAGGRTVTLSRSNPAAVIPNSVVVPAGQSIVYFNITTTQVASPTVVSITATTPGNSVVNQFTIEPCVPGPGSPATGFNATDIVWIDDALPAGMSLGTAQWDTGHHASGSQSLTLPPSSGYQQFQLTGATTPFPVYASEQLFTYVLPSECAPTREIMLGWHTTTGVWKKAYVGQAVIGGEGSAFNAGAMPQAGFWNSIRVSANALGLNGMTIDGFSVETSDGQVFVDHIGKTCLQPFATPPSLPAGDTYWIDDTVPLPDTNGPFTTAQHASGTKSLYDTYTTQYADSPFPIYVGEKLVAYVLTDYCSTPQEIRITWMDSYGGTGGVYWGATQPADAGLRFMGAVPSPGAWVRLEVPANLVNLEERWLATLSLKHTGGAMWWDAIGKGGSGCTLATAPAPSIPAGDSVILDDMPAGAPWGSDTDGSLWTTQQHASGNQSWSVPYPEAPGYHNDHVTGLPPMSILPGENLIAYVLLDPCSPPNEIAVTWNGTHGAYWGTPHGWESGYASMGAITATPGTWQRLEVPAGTVNMTYQSLTAVQYNWQDGEAWWDHAGKSGTACHTTIAPPPASLPGSDVVWIDDALPSGATSSSLTFDNTEKASGSLSMTNGYASGLHDMHVSFVTPFVINHGDTMAVYVMLDDCAPPTEVMLRWSTTSGQTKGAYWGTPHNLGEGSPYISMGALPATGGWVRLEVAASQLGLEGLSVNGVDMISFDGRTWFDRLGVAPCVMPLAAAPSFPSGDTVWIDDNVPAGANDTSWSTAQHASGTRAIGIGTAATGSVNFDINGINPTLPIYVGEKLVTYALVDSCSATSEIVMYVGTTAGDFRAAYWGTPNGNEGSNAVSMGAVPPPAQWTRLEVPATALGIEERQIYRIVLGYTGGRVWFDHVGKAGTACIPPSVAPPSFPSGDTVWIDDNVPTGWSDTSWDSTYAASGTRAIGGAYAQGGKQTFNTQGAPLLPVWVGEKIVFYTLIDPCAPTNEIALFLRTSAGEWVGAYWGTTTGQEDGNVIQAGALPPAGQWARLEVPASLLKIEERQIDRIEFQTFAGHAWIDHVGKGGTACIPPTATAPSFPAGDTVWIDDNVPSGWSDTNWDTSQAASGTRAIGSWYAQGGLATFDMHTEGPNPLPIAIGEKFVFYTLIDPCAPPSEIVMFVETTSGEFVAASWGTINGTEERTPISIGAVPAAGSWVRLEVPASVLGVEDRDIYRIRFQNYGGHVWYDRVGKAGNACIAPAAAQPSFPAGDTVWIDDNVPTSWNDIAWDTREAASGTRSIGGRYAQQGQNELFDTHTEGPNPLPVAIGEKFVFYALVDPCAPPSEIVLFVETTSGEFVAASWGTINGAEERTPITIGAVPAAGSWVRLEVPASVLGVEDRDIYRIRLQTFGGHVWYDHVGKAGNACVAPAASQPSFPAGDTVWIDDNVPSGWNDISWDTREAASGTRSAGYRYAQGGNSGFDTTGSPTLPLASGETFVLYALVNPCAPPSEIVFFVETTAGEYVAASWGTINGTEERVPVSMGPVPAAGSWVRLEVPASTLGLDARDIYRLHVQVYGGQVWLDHIGKF